MPWNNRQSEAYCVWSEFQRARHHESPWPVRYGLHRTRGSKYCERCHRDFYQIIDEVMGSEDDRGPVACLTPFEYELLWKMQVIDSTRLPENKLAGAVTLLELVEVLAPGRHRAYCGPIYEALRQLERQNMVSYCFKPERYWASYWVRTTDAQWAVGRLSIIQAGSGWQSWRPKGD